MSRQETGFSTVETPPCGTRGGVRGGRPCVVYRWSLLESGRNSLSIEGIIGLEKQRRRHATFTFQKMIVSKQNQSSLAVTRDDLLERKGKLPIDLDLLTVKVYVIQLREWRITQHISNSFHLRL
jgi:hypothetical protein